MSERPRPVAPKRSATLYDVAALAGVSHQTVSRLVRGQTNINPEIRARIEKAIAELNYRPNRTAQSLATSRSHRLGALFFERLDQVGPARIVQGASDAAREAGYVLDIVGLEGHDRTSIANARAMIDQTDVAGIMIFAPTVQLMRELEQTQFTVPILLEVDANQQSADPGRSGNEVGTTMLAEHLLELGHRVFYEIAGPLEWVASLKRDGALRAAIASGGGVLIGVTEGDWTPESGYRAAMQIPLDRGITAVTVGNDQMALGAIKALAERGVRVPEDMSVVGFDDIPEASFFMPALTTVRLDFDLQGRLVIKRLLEMVDPTLSLPALNPLAPQLHIRASTAPPRA